MKKPYPAFVIFFVIFSVSVGLNTFFGLSLMANKTKVANITNELTKQEIPASLGEIKIAELLSGFRNEFQRSIFSKEGSLQRESTYNASKIYRLIEEKNNNDVNNILRDSLDVINNKAQSETDITFSKWTLLDGVIEKKIENISENSFANILLKLNDVERMMADDVSIFKIYVTISALFQAALLITVFRLFVRPLSKIQQSIDNNHKSTRQENHWYANIRELYQLQQAINKLHATMAENNQMHRTISANMEKAKDSAEERAEFMSSMNHEINTPLASIGIIVYLIENTKLDPEQKTYIEKLKSSIEYLSKLIERVLKVSKMHANRLELDSTPFSLSKVVNDVHTILEPISSKKKLLFSTHIDENLPELLIGDELNVKEILLNFASNSIKFTKVGSVHIHISLISKDNDAVQIKIAVSDTGPGISSDALPMLFQRYSQINRKAFVGTGLGLAIAKGLAILMNGTVGVESKENIGSTFWAQIYLGISPQIISAKTNEQNQFELIEVKPAGPSIDDQTTHLLMQILNQAKSDLHVTTSTWRQNQEMLEESLGDAWTEINELMLKFDLKSAADRIKTLIDISSEDDCDTTQTSGGTTPVILVIDDTPGNLDLIGLLFKNVADVKVAIDPNRGIQIARTDPKISLIMLDISMPIKNGHEVLGEIKSDPAAKDIPIIMISASESHDTRERCLTAGAVDFIGRNSSPKTILDLVEKHRRSIPTALH